MSGKGNEMQEFRLRREIGTPAIQSKGIRPSPSNNLKGLHPAASELHLYL